MTANKKKVLLVCLGNICRSPTAHGVLEKMVEDAGLIDAVEVDSAGTYGGHTGQKPDRRAIAAALTRGYVLEHLRARTVTLRDFYEYDYVLAMDSSNLRDLQSLCPPEMAHKVALFMSHAPKELGFKQEVPDPYYGGTAGFELVLDMVEAASRGLLQKLNQH